MEIKPKREITAPKWTKDYIMEGSEMFQKIIEVSRESGEDESTHLI